MQQVEAISALGALAQETRLSVFRTLVRAGPGGMTAGEVADVVAALPSTLSHHFGQLERANLVRSRREGRTVVYAADYEGMRRLLGFLMEDCCQGRPEICGEGVAPAACSQEEICA